jgi:hypothetical protein
MSEFLDRTELPDELLDTVVQFVKRMIQRARPSCRTVRVPTYYGSAYETAVADGLVPEFGKPWVPVLIHRVSGVRIVLGTDDLSNLEAPDILIERRPNGWAFFMHPMGGGDPSCHVYFVDDGRSFVVPEQGVTPNMEVREWEEVAAEVDRAHQG